MKSLQTISCIIILYFFLSAMIYADENKEEDKVENKQGISLSLSFPVLDESDFEKGMIYVNYHFKRKSLLQPVLFSGLGWVIKFANVGPNEAGYGFPFGMKLVIGNRWQIAPALYFMFWNYQIGNDVIYRYRAIRFSIFLHYFFSNGIFLSTETGNAIFEFIQKSFWPESDYFINLGIGYKF